jgi:O-antigen ligase/tetratricopeptide (TPR) repeat protein
VLVIYVVLLGGTYAGVVAVGLRITSLSIIAVGLVCWAALAWRRPEWRPRTAIWPAFVLPLAALALSTLLSPFPRLGLDYLAWAIILVALYLLLVRVMSMPPARERVGGLAAFLGIALGLLYIAMVATRWLEWWELLGRFEMPMLRPTYLYLLGNGPTIVAPMLILLSATAFGGLGWREGSRGRRGLLAILTVVTLAAVLLTGTRGSWLALAVALGVVVAGMAFRSRGRLRVRLGDRRSRVVLVVGVAVALLLLAVAVPGLAQLAARGDGGRTALATVTLRMFESSPLTGEGPGTFAPRRSSHTEPGEFADVVPHAHNLYLQTLGEAGLLGAVAGLVTIGAVLWLLAGGLRDPDAGRRRWTWAAFFALLYVGVNSLVDGFANLPHVMLLAALPLAVVDATSRQTLGLPFPSPGGTWARRIRTATAVTVFVAAGIAVAGLYRIESIAMIHDRAVLAVEAGDWEAAAPDATTAAIEDPAMPPYQLTRGLAAAESEDWGTAVLAFAAAVSVDDQPETWLNLALALHELGRPDEEVRAAIDSALRLGGQRPDILVPAASLYARIDEAELADEAWAQALLLAPSLAADDAFTGLIGSRERFVRLLDAAIELSDSPWVLALMASDTERAQRLAAGADDGGLASRVVAAWGGDPQAVADLQAEALAHPSDRVLLDWAARTSAHAGDDANAGRFRRLGTFATGLPHALGHEVRVASPGSTSAQRLAVLSQPYGYVLYRRPTTDWLLAAGLSSVGRLDAVR